MKHQYVSQEDHKQIARHLRATRQSIHAAIEILNGKAPVALMDALLKLHNEGYYRTVRVLESDRSKRNSTFDGWDYYMDPDEKWTL